MNCVTATPTAAPRPPDSAFCQLKRGRGAPLTRDMDPVSTSKPATSGRARRAPPLRTLVWLAMAGGFVGLCAADSRSTLQVTANVMAVAHLEMTAPAPLLLISAADLARGYLDTPRPLRLRVFSNSRAGFALDVATLSPWFTAVALEGFDAEVSLGAEGGTIVQRWQGEQSRALQLRMRFKLAAGLAPGLYAWPLQLRARPL